MVVIARQRGGVNEAVSEGLVERNERAEREDAGDRAVEVFTNVRFEIFCFQELCDFARSNVCAALVGATNFTKAGPVFTLVELASEYCFDAAMREQIWIAPNGRGEVRVMLVRETEVTAVGRCVNRLW